MSPSIRRAGIADADSLSRIGIRTFVDTFGHLYPDEDLQAFLHDSHSPQAYAQQLDDPDYGFWMLERDGAAIGYAMAGPCGLVHPQRQCGDGELKRLYVLAEAQNGGWGRQLFDTAIAWLQQQGRHTIWISVWSENVGAQRFYQRAGFEKVGEYEFAVGRVRDREFMLRRAGRAA